MNGNANIFDILIAPGPSSPAVAQPDAASGVTGGEQPFAALFGSMLGIGMSGPAITSEESGDLLGMLSPEQTAKTDPGELKATLPSFDLMAAGMVQGIADGFALRAGVTAAADTEPTNDGVVQKVRSVLLNTPGMGQPTLLTQTSEIPVELLAGGHFKAKEAEIKDGRLNISLRGDKGSDTVEYKLSLPLDKLASELTGLNGSATKLVHGRVGVPARVALTDPGVSLAHLSQFASGLNIKAVEINVADASQQSEADEPVIDIKSFIQQQGREVIFRDLVPTDKISVTETRKRVFQPSTVTVETDAPSGLETRTVTAKTDAETEQQSLPFRTAPRNITAQAAASKDGFKELFSTETTSDQADAKNNSRSHVDLSQIQNSVARENPELIRPAQAIRFSLPDGLDRVLKPGSSGIMIRIEPDNLGPAKLNLHFRGDGLIARVTVDNPAVRSMVEGSLDHLRQQLHLAGIKVDHLEVNVGAGSDHQPRFNEPPAWGRRVRSGAFASYLNSSEDSSQLISSLPPRQAGFVGPDGVNMYA